MISIDKLNGLDPFPTFSNQANNRNEIIRGHESSDLGYAYLPLFIISGFFSTLLTRNI